LPGTRNDGCLRRARTAHRRAREVRDVTFQNLTHAARTPTTSARGRRLAVLLVLGALAVTACGGRSVEEATDVANDRSASRFDRCIAMDDLAVEGAVAVDTLHALAADPNPRIARCATKSIADIEDPKAVPALNTLLADRDRQVVIGAATALGRIGDGRSARPLGDLVTAKDPRVVAAAVEALGRIDDPRAVRPLERVAVRGLTAHGVDRAWRKTRFTAVFALGELRDPRAEATLLRVMRTDRANSGPAGRALTKIFADRVGHLLPLLEDPANVRLAYALVDLGRPGTEEALAAVLMRHGDVNLAEYYLNCGSGRLERAAHRWASAHGYTVTSMPGVPGNEWGSGL
jgi:HEAT repeat protein